MDRRINRKFGKKDRAPRRGRRARSRTGGVDCESGETEEQSGEAAEQTGETAEQSGEACKEQNRRRGL